MIALGTNGKKSWELRGGRLVGRRFKGSYGGVNVGIEFMNHPCGLVFGGVDRKKFIDHRLVEVVYIIVGGFGEFAKRGIEGFWRCYIGKRFPDLEFRHGFCLNEDMMVVVKMSYSRRSEESCNSYFIKGMVSGLH